MFFEAWTKLSNFFALVKDGLLLKCLFFANFKVWYILPFFLSTAAPCQLPEIVKSFNADAENRFWVTIRHSPETRTAQSASLH